ncbi:hypothetical protein GCM10010994_37450 [Chelatococcus reniformis]|uniref:Uncharacterized protein n=1 Tax=Chelatococcus reniformis TaxID=1494448 RepID=A0A916UJ80_9HYPH|nr:hypothetical protein GCM10010994_37450 [Chelatococcus reniformis]
MDRRPDLRADDLRDRLAQHVGEAEVAGGDAPDEVDVLGKEAPVEPPLGDDRLAQAGIDEVAGEDVLDPPGQGVQRQERGRDAAPDDDEARRQPGQDAARDRMDDHGCATQTS